MAGLRRAGHRDNLEGYYDPGNFFDPRDYLFEQVPLFGATPTTRNDRDEGRDYPVFRTEQDLCRRDRRSPDMLLDSTGRKEPLTRQRTPSTSWLRCKGCACHVI